MQTFWGHFAVGMLMTSVVLPATAGVYEERARDWRNGAVVYQVIVDRFAPAGNLDAKRALYPAPKVLRRWDEVPVANGQLAPGTQITRHELDFWGGDLQSLRGKLDHVQGLGADVLYLNPLHLGFTNHKYDSLDFQAVSPEYGTRDDVKALAADLKRRKIKKIRGQYIDPTVRVRVRTPLGCTIGSLSIGYKIGV